MNLNPWSGEVVPAGILTLMSAAASSAKVASSNTEQPVAGRDAKLQQPPGFATSPWPIVIAIAAALCVMAAVTAWDQKHKG
jgi:hypothetical protein